MNFLRSHSLPADYSSRASSNRFDFQTRCALGSIESQPTCKKAQLVFTYRPPLDRFSIFINRSINTPSCRSRSREQQSLRLNISRKRATKFEGIGGHSAVGVLGIGPGKTVLLRADMDALPIKEETDIAYASQTQMIDLTDSQRKPVMYACGHDIHITFLMATASCLSAALTEWSGTLICLFQPDEEVGDRARSMIKDGPYDKIPRPDLLLAQHVWPLRAGTVAISLGPVFSAAYNFKVRVFGKGDHASRPDSCVDPIVLTSHIIVRLQSVASREVPPQSVAVVTCGSIHGGFARNIPDFVEFTLSVQSYEPGVRSRVLESIRRIVKTEFEASGFPREPEIERTDEAPPVINDDELTSTLRKTFSDAFGHEVQSMIPTLAIEDFPYLVQGGHSLRLLDGGMHRSLRLGFR